MVSAQLRLIFFSDNSFQFTQLNFVVVTNMIVLSYSLQHFDLGDDKLDDGKGEKNFLT
jgi:hypothetical protein